MTHIVCCNDSNLALCGEHLTPTSSSQPGVCSPCWTANITNPMPCPKGRDCPLSVRQS